MRRLSARRNLGLVIILIAAAAAQAGEGAPAVAIAVVAPPRPVHRAGALAPVGVRVVNRAATPIAIEHVTGTHALDAPTRPQLDVIGVARGDRDRVQIVPLEDDAATTPLAALLLMPGESIFLHVELWLPLELGRDGTLATHASVALEVAFRPLVADADGRLPAIAALVESERGSALDLERLNLDNLARLAELPANGRLHRVDDGVPLVREASSLQVELIAEDAPQAVVEALTRGEIVLASESLAAWIAYDPSAGLDAGARHVAPRARTPGAWEVAWPQSITAAAVARLERLRSGRIELELVDDEARAAFVGLTLLPVHGTPRVVVDAPERDAAGARFGALHVACRDGQLRLSGVAR